MTLTIEPDGTIKGLYTEDIDLSTLGTLHIERATNVEFDEAGQEWVVFDIQRRPLFRNSSRQICLQWEKDNL